MNAVTQWPVVPSEAQPDAALLSTAFEACPEGLAIVEDGRILYANSAFARSLGFSWDGLVRGRLLAELMPDIPAAVQTASTVIHDSGRDLTIVTARRFSTHQTQGAKLRRAGNHGSTGQRSGT